MRSIFRVWPKRMAAQPAEQVLSAQERISSVALALSRAAGSARGADVLGCWPYSHTSMPELSLTSNRKMAKHVVGKHELDTESRSSGPLGDLI
jgi:hypothetical protein